MCLLSDDDNDDFGYLVFDDKELANSLEAEAKNEFSSRKESNFAAHLSTRSETEEEKALRF